MSGDITSWDPNTFPNRLTAMLCATEVNKGSHGAIVLFEDTSDYKWSTIQPCGRITGVLKWAHLNHALPLDLFV
jgi:hypothetical protein